jgi:subtilisin-like proprotein convertase family protein
MKKITLLFALLAFAFQIDAQTYTGSNLTVVGIPDNMPGAGASTLVTMSGVPTSGISILDIQVDLAINHTWVGDITVTLQAPSGGPTITLIGRPGVPEPPAGAGDSSNLLSTSVITMDDASVNQAENMGAAEGGSTATICQDAPFMCDFQPHDGTSPDTFADLIVALGASDPNGDWTVYAEDAAAGDTGDFFVAELRIITMTLGLGENEIQGFKYSPNPVKNNLNLRAANAIENISVYNLLGQEVMRSKPNAVSNDLDMSDLQAGAYFVKVSVGDVSQTVRIIKQ